MTSLKKITLKWKDHSSLHGWVDTEELPEPVVMRSTGYLLKETDEYYVITTTVYDDRSQCADPFCILKSDVI